jgi:prolipoprotein diacylglyceryltransferase
MSNELFLLGLALGCALLLTWGFKVLPREHWQILATLPLRRNADGSWQGLNLTWYGLLTANAYLAAVALLLVLLGALAVPLTGVLLVAALLLGLCVPASRLVARIVEGKAHTFTVGGAVFVGLLAAPWIIFLVNTLVGATQVPPLPTLAAIGIAYALGEGLGRLACISFGCCYGQPVDQCRPLVRKLFGRWHFTFAGSTKKIAYASGLEGARVIPIQGITAILYCFCALLGAWLFLRGAYANAFLLTTLVTQLWRVGSELLRADYRGCGKLSAYQVMGLLGVPYALVTVWLFDGGAAALPNLTSGLGTLWNPLVLVALQGLWLALFVFTGRSSVTGAQLSFHVHHDRI